MMTRHSFAVRRVALLLLTLALAGACSRDGDPLAGGTNGVGSGSDPGDGVFSEEEAFLVLAEQQLVSKCMRDAGFEYVAVKPKPTSVSTGNSAVGYEERSVSVRRTEGYGLAKIETVVVEEVPAEARVNNEIIARLSAEDKERYTLALFGADRTAISVTLPGGKTISTNADGCLSDARRALYRDLDRWLLLDYVGSNSKAEISAAVRGDKRFLTALRKWVDCMAARGFKVEDPANAKEEAAAAYRSTADRASARARELEIAVADGECGDQTSFYTVLAEVEKEHTAAVRAKNEANLIALREMQAEARDRAKKLLVGTGSGG